MANKPHEFPKFTPLDSATVQRMMSKIPQYLHNVSAALGIDNLNKLLVDQEALFLDIETYAVQT